MQDANVVDPGGSAARFFKPARHSFDSEEIFVRILPGQLADECAVAAAKIDLHRRAPAKDLFQIKTGDVGIGD